MGRALVEEMRAAASVITGENPGNDRLVRGVG